MPKYRYRTCALHGPWRETPQLAARDAILAAQATADPDDPLGLAWRLPGEIETRAPERFTSLQ
jgi:hypothetical protein